MVFVDNILDLWYYRKKADEPCYCEQLVYPNDILLQGLLSTNYTSVFSYHVFVYSPDGLTQYENATSYFSFYVGVNPNGAKFFNLRCEEYSPAMCTYQCYILRVQVAVNNNIIFDKYTEQYCQTNCCDIPRGITFDADEYDITTEVLTEYTEPVPYARCEIPMLRIRAVFECIDNETGLFYGLPTSVLFGSALFTYEKITNLTAKIRRDPREINKTTSYNCNVQRSESFNPYLLEGTAIEAIVPEWKLNELENMMHASFIEVNDFGIRYGKKEFKFPGGVIGERFYICWDVFKIKIKLQDCTVRTDFGCGECESISAYTYLIPGGSPTGKKFYNEARQLIGDADALLAYYEALGFDVTDTSGTYPNTSMSFTIQGNGLLPSSLYYDFVTPQNRVFGTTAPVAPVINCAMFDLGIIYSEDTPCANFDLGIIYSENETNTTADILDIGNWVATGTSTLTATTGKLSFTSVNAAITVSEVFAGEAIGIIDYPGKPTIAQALYINGDVQLTIDTDGIIRYYGEPTSVSGAGSSITITDIFYTL